MISGAVPARQGREPSSRKLSSAMRLTVNGRICQLDVAPDATLLSVLRDQLYLTGAKPSCERGECGACTVLVADPDGKPEPVYSLPRARARLRGRLRHDYRRARRPARRPHPVQAAFIEHDAVQCGFCTPGQVLAAVALLAARSRPVGRGDRAGHERQPVSVRHLPEDRSRDPQRRVGDARIQWRLIRRDTRDARARSPGGSSRPRSRSRAARRRRSSSCPNTSRRHGTRTPSCTSSASARPAWMRRRRSRPGSLHGGPNASAGCCTPPSFARRSRAARVSLDLAPARAVAGVVDVIGSAELERRIRLAGGALFDTSDCVRGSAARRGVCRDRRRRVARRRGHRRALRAGAARRDLRRRRGRGRADGAPIVEEACVRRPGDGRQTWRPASPDIVERGDVTRGLAEADVVVRREYRTPVQLHTALEPHGAVAEWDGDRLTIWESTQAVFRVREQVALGLGISQSSVRVIKEHMGGGFGAKTSAGAHTFVAAMLARRTGRPVRCVNDREAEQTDTGNRPSHGSSASR